MQFVELRIALIVLALLISPAVAAESFGFTPTFSSGSYRWSVDVNGGSGTNNPTLHLMRGQTYDFIVATNVGHPFYVKTVNSTGSGNAYSGFAPNGISTSTTQTVSFLVPANAPDRLFYNCSIHGSMAGTIDVSIFRDGLGD